MGITGLLPFLEKATRPCHISEFRGGTAAVDSYCWLHKGANAFAEQLARGEDNQLYVQFCLKYIRMLLSYDIRPIMVFDGKNLPAKSETEAKRRELRKNARQRAAELLRLGKTEEARTYLKQCVDITPQMANNLIKECRKLQVDCIVAPYESDAQLAFFNLKGIAEVVITEDSDLVLFGCKKVFYKLDVNGSGQLVEADQIYLAMKMRPDQYTFDKFRYMCILSGCDYLDSLHGIGLKKAQKFISLTAETNPEIFLDKIPRYLNMQRLNITNDYKENFMIANATFQHQIVFDPFKKKLIHLTDPDITGTKLDYCKNSGEIFDHEKAYQVAIGNLNPYSFEKVDNWCPLSASLSSNSIWSGIYKKRVSRKQEKESSKVQMQKFLRSSSFASTSSNSKIIVIDNNKIKDEEDLQLEKELLFYRKRHTEDKSESPPIIEKMEEIEDKELSPVISRNPFLAKKKLSKFPQTGVQNSSVIVRSRFFSNFEVEDSRQDNLNNTNNTGETETFEVISRIEEINTEETEEKTENFEIISKKRPIEDTEIMDISNDSMLESDVEMKSQTKNEANEESDVEMKSQTKSEASDCNVTAEPISVLLQKNIDRNGSLKRRKLGPCKPLGLQKKSRQQTLQYFFSSIKKD